MAERQPEDYYAAGHMGCSRLRQLLGQPIDCLECPLPKCLYDMSDEEIEAVEERLRLTEHV